MDKFSEAISEKFYRLAKFDVLQGDILAKDLREGGEKKPCYR